MIMIFIIVKVKSVWKTVRCPLISHCKHLHVHARGILHFIIFFKYGDSWKPQVRISQNTESRWYPQIDCFQAWKTSENHINILMFSLKWKLYRETTDNTIF